MAILNNNAIARKDDDSIVEASFIRITSYHVVDYRSNNTSVTIQFNFYASRDKWEADRRVNAIKVKGVKDNTLQIEYSRNENGVDIMAYCYTDLITHLLKIFPTWDPELLSIDMVTPEEEV